MKRLMIILGTRPEAIKLMPVILEARRRADQFETVVVSTAQHREMLDGIYEDFEVQPDIDLNLMQPKQTPIEFLSSALLRLQETLAEYPTDCVLVQGDTMTTLAGAMAGSYLRCKVAHVEAGLRSFHREHPWPEEDNRRLVSRVTDFHFAPTESAKGNLIAEGVDAGHCWVTGNTGIDALHIMRKRQVSGNLKGSKLPSPSILLTCHRRENFGKPMESICNGILKLLVQLEDLHVLCPVHRNPAVRSVLENKLSGHPRVRLVDPMGYAQFIHAMADCDLILTDSGGVQEEAPSLGRPVLVLRDTTERPEAVAAGVAKIVGTQADLIASEAGHLLSDPVAYAAMARVENPFGDGHATARILDVLQEKAL